MIFSGKIKVYDGHLFAKIIELKVGVDICHGSRVELLNHLDKTLVMIILTG